MNSDAVKRLVAMSKRVTSINLDTLVAIYTPQPYASGLARMWEIFMDATDWETRAFSDRVEAATWLRKRAKDKYGIDIVGL